MSTSRPIGVVGAGNMGSGIAQKIATEGWPVVLVDVDQAAVERGMQRLRTLLGEAVERKILTPQRVDAILSRITPSADIAACRDCSLVIEAVFEDLDVKRQLFGKLDAVCGADTLLATNTSSFYVRDVAAATRRPDRVVGMHYFYHPAKNRLVEVIPGTDTSEATRQWAWTFAEATGKTPIASADAPGFVVNRYFVPWINEAVRLHAEGLDIPTIEAASKEAFRIGMGPFQLMNVTGVPIAMHAAATLGRELGDFYVPSPRLVAQVESRQDWPLSGGEADRSRFQEIADRLQGVTFYIACQMVDEKVCTIEDADIGARVGLRWALGPFELANRVGLEAARAKVEALAARYPDVQVPKLLRQTAACGGGFAFRWVNLEVRDGLAEITLNRPDALNALNEDVVSQLAAAFDAADARSDVRTIVLRGAGKAFVAGADIKFFVRRMDEKDLDRIVRFTRTGQELLQRIDASRKHVVVRLDGLSLGGGSELALSADTIVATERGSLGFPETGIGIYPGLGGTQRTTRRIGAGLARWMILCGETVDARTALAMGLVDEVVAADRIGERILEIHRSGERPSRARPEPDARLQALQSFFTSADLETLLTGAATPDDAAVAKSAGRVRHKAPLACRLADRMIREGASRGIEAGLALELEHLKEIFGTADAYEGLSALLAGRRPVYQGR